MLKATVVHADAWQYQSGKNDVAFELPENGDREDFVIIEVRSPDRVDCFGISEGKSGNKRALPLASGTFYSHKLRLQGFTSIVLQPTKSVTWAFSVTSREGRRNEKLDPTKLQLIPPRHDVSDLAALVEEAIARRLGRENDGFEDPDNSLSFDDMSEDEFSGGYMEAEDELGDGYMEAKPRRLDKPPAVKPAAKPAEAAGADTSDPVAGGGDNNGDD